MAKIYGINGVITGKLGAAVYAVRNGEQISRQYQPVVSNPSTPNQVEARAKLKLLSQLSAVMAPVIAMRRVGAVSSRNFFLKENYSAATYSDGNADIQLLNVKLTKSVVAMPAIGAALQENSVFAYITSAETLGDLDFDRIVYAAFAIQADNTMRYVGSRVAESAGTSGNWKVEFGTITEKMVVYAYGMRDNTEAAKTVFANMTILSATSIAEIVTSRRLLDSDVTLSETSSVLYTPAP